MVVGASIFFEFNLPNSTTWFYFSLLLAIALFFRFTRFFSVRNLDVVALFLLVPGLLLLLQAQAESHEGDSHWYRDTYTGTSMDRPGFRQLMRDIESGRVETLVVWRLDRLGRTAKGLTSLFEDQIRCKVNLISLKDGLDLVTPAGRLMANVLAGVAAYETEVRAERIMAGQSAARDRGVH